MNNGFEDEDHFNIDMIMHENQYNSNKIIKEDLIKNEENQKKDIPFTSRLKSKKNRKLALRKNKDGNSRHKLMKQRIERDQNEQKVYICHHPQCEKVFLDRNSYRKHLITHGEKQFICQAEACGKRFLDNSKLKRHMLVHSGDKPYKCELCNKRFSLDFNLRTHLRIHTGEKPYVCSFEGCYKRFSQSSNLSAHEKTHFLPKGEENENIKTNTIPTRKKIFKVIHANQVIEKPKPIVILDRHRYLEKIMEEHKKNEERKKLEEEEKLKKEQEELEKKKEEEIKYQEKIKENKEIISAELKINFEEIPEEEESEENINLEKDENNETENINFNKINNMSNVSGIEIEKINILVNNIINKNEKSEKINYLDRGNIVNIYEEIGNDISKIREKIELNNLIKNLNFIDDDNNYEEKTSLNLEIPYYLTKEWVVKNLLN